MRRPSWKISDMPPAMLPGAMPPMSAWCAMLQTNAMSSPSANTGIARLTSGRCVPPATNGSLATNRSPSWISSVRILRQQRLHQPPHRGEMDRQRLMRLDHQPAAAVHDRGRVVVALLDVGRIGAPHQRGEGLVGHRAQRVGQDLERDRVEVRRGVGHGASSIRRLPAASTVRVVAREEQGRGVELLDHRRPGSALARLQRRALVDRRSAAPDPGRTRPARARPARAASRSPRACLRRRRPVEPAARGQAEVHDLHRIVRVVSSHRRSRAPRRSAARSPAASGRSPDVERHRELEVLADVAQIQAELEPAGGRRHAPRARTRLRPAAATRRSGCGSRSRSDASTGSRRPATKSSLRSETTRPWAHRMPGAAGTRIRRMPSAAATSRRVQRAGAAERHQREAARVVAALDRDRADRAHHVGGDHAEQAMRGALQREAETLRQRRERARAPRRRRAPSGRRAGRAARGGRAPDWRRSRSARAPPWP